MKTPGNRIPNIIIGSGAAAYAAALRLDSLGQEVLLVTDRRENGTSRNAGSDKQTYYKLSLCGENPDSVGKMASTLFAGGSVHGDIAYAEAAGSTRGFLFLTELGVPFPTNRQGEFVGYKTDNDPCARGSSAGPLTSRFMTEKLEAEFDKRGLSRREGLTVVKLLRRNEGQERRIYGLIALDTKGEPVFLRAENILLATGGPAGIYKNVVYPLGQTGMTGLALEAGASLTNFCEWQYGIASVKFRWNLSGSYQQVLPAYYSLDKAGHRHDFLEEAMPAEEVLEAIFLKGYQWPFSYAHLEGSSRVDMALQEELEKGRRVFMDYRENPRPLRKIPEDLPPVAREYLESSGALGATPLERLEKMNPAALALYRSHGIDLAREPLEITLAAQHCNGGVTVDASWESDVPGLYVIGEAAGTFGVSRPGGSALNSGQVGALRAAQAIATSAPREEIPDEEIIREAEEALSEIREKCSAFLQGEKEVPLLRDAFREEMSRAAGPIRQADKFGELEKILSDAWQEMENKGKVSSPAELAQAFVARDSLLSARALLSAEKAAAASSGSRGSAVYIREGKAVPEDASYRAFALETRWQSGEFLSEFVPVRPLPQPDQWFERVWRDYRERWGE